MDHRDNQLINGSTLQEKPDLRKHGEPDQVGYLDWSLKQRVLSTRFGYDIFLIQTSDDIPAIDCHGEITHYCHGEMLVVSVELEDGGEWFMLHHVTIGWADPWKPWYLWSHNDNAGSYRQKTPNFS